jgi:hypothetical protein
MSVLVPLKESRNTNLPYSHILKKKQNVHESTKQINKQHCTIGTNNKNDDSFVSTEGHHGELNNI